MERILMAQGMNSIDKKRELKEKYLDFALDKTQKTYFEAGNSLGKSFLTYLLLLCLTALLVFGKGIKDEVKIPFLDITVNKTYAALVILILSCAAFYWYISTTFLHTILGIKLRWLIYERYGVFKDNNWYLRFPSAYSSFLTVNTRPKSLFADIMLFAFSVFLLISSSLLPVLMTWLIGGSFGLSNKYKILICIGMLLLQTPSIYVLYSFQTGKPEPLIKHLDKDDENKEIVIPVFDLSVDESRHYGPQRRA